MKIFVKEDDDLATIKITGDDNKVWVNIFIDKAQTAGEDMKHDEILIRTEVGEIKAKFLRQFPYKKEVLFWEYNDSIIAKIVDLSKQQKEGGKTWEYGVLKEGE